MDFRCCESSKAWNESLGYSNAEIDIVFGTPKLGRIPNFTLIRGREGSHIISEWKHLTEQGSSRFGKIAESGLGKAAGSGWRLEVVGNQVATMGKALELVFYMVKPTGQQASIMDATGWWHDTFAGLTDPIMRDCISDKWRRRRQYWWWRLPRLMRIMEGLTTTKVQWPEMTTTDGKLTEKLSAIVVVAGTFCTFFGEPAGWQRHGLIHGGLGNAKSRSMVVDSF